MGRRMSVAEINAKKPINSKVTALELVENCGRRSMVICVCECGNIKNMLAGNIRSGAALSCGCVGREITIERNKKGKKEVRAKKKENYLRKVWYNMIERCTRPTHFAYKSYGAKGVIVCSEWLNSFDTFKKWALDNGWVKGVYLDKDILGNGKVYSPETCCFVDRLTSDKNKTSNVKHEYMGRMLSIADIAKEAGVSCDGLRRRVREKMSINEAINNIKLGIIKPYTLTDAHREKIIKTIGRSVVDLDTGQVYRTIREAASTLGISESYLSMMVNGKEPNKTSMKLVANT